MDMTVGRWSELSQLSQLFAPAVHSPVDQLQVSDGLEVRQLQAFPRAASGCKPQEVQPKGGWASRSQSQQIWGKDSVSSETMAGQQHWSPFPQDKYMFYMKCFMFVYKYRHFRSPNDFIFGLLRTLFGALFFLRLSLTDFSVSLGWAQKHADAHLGRNHFLEVFRATLADIVWCQDPFLKLWMVQIADDLSKKKQVQVQKLIL